MTKTRHNYERGAEKEEPAVVLSRKAGGGERARTTKHRCGDYAGLSRRRVARSITGVHDGATFRCLRALSSNVVRLNNSQCVRSFSAH